MLKKMFLPLLALCTLGLSIINTTPTYAREMGTQGKDCTQFLGITTWDCGIGTINGEDDLKKAIWQIMVNISIDITVIASYLIIGYVIYGGYLYIFSGGDTTKVANGKKALNQAFIGMAIVLSANVILNGIRAALVGSGQTFLPSTNAGLVITNAISWAIGVCGIVAAVYVVGGGIMYITSSGDSTKLQKAKNMILYALIGLVIVALAEVITAFISNSIREANKAQGSSIIIPKEENENIKIS